MITKELAEILGLLCAEGSYINSVSSYYEPYRNGKRFRKNKKSIRIEFYNKDLRLLKHYQELLFKEFNYNSKITKHGKINIGNRKIINEILKFTNLGHLNWKVPLEVKNADYSVKLAFVRGFFDGDGTASGMIRFFSTNKLGLEQVSGILSDIGFENGFHGPFFKEGRKPHYIIRISRKERERFLNEVKPISKRPDYVGITSKLMV